jgi:hypothetical protein
VTKHDEVRPHSSLGYRTPLEFKATDAATIAEGRSPAMPVRADEKDPKTEQPLTGAIFQ